MELDTSEKKASEEPFDTDKYYDEESDIIGAALKTNIKQDPASVRSRPRLIPVHNLNLEDEDKIPAMPDLLAKPDDKSYDKAIKELKEKIDFHYKSIEDLKEKIRKEKFGNNPQINDAYTEKNAAYEKQNALNAEIEQLKKSIEGPASELAKLKAEKEILGKSITTLKIETLNAEINKIQEKLGFASLNATEEKKLIDRKTKLEEEKPDVERYSEISQRIKEIHQQHKSTFDKLSELNKQREPLFEKIKVLKTKVEKFKTQAKENDPAVKNLQTQVGLIKEEIKKCKEKINELTKECDDKWYYYEKQQKFIEYIKKAQDKIVQLKKKAEKERKRKEKEEKANPDLKATEEGIIQVSEGGKYDHEIWLCDWLAEYFKTLTVKKDVINVGGQPVEQVKALSKIDEDISKGLIKQVNRESVDNEFVIGMTSAPVAKKKTKGPKVSKREQVVQNSNLMNLDISIIQKIKDLQLVPPVHKSDIPAFLEKIAQAKEKFQREDSNINMTTKDNVTIPITSNVTTATAVSNVEIPEVKVVAPDQEQPPVIPVPQKEIPVTKEEEKPSENGDIDIAKLQEESNEQK